MNPSERRSALHSCEADLLWLLLENRYQRAVAILTDSEMQAAIIRAQNPSGGKMTEGSTAWSDPTGDTALTEAATEIRATAIRKVWVAEVREVADAVATLHQLTAEHLGEPVDRRPLNIATTLRSLRWLTIIPHDRVIGHPASDEYDHAIAWARDRARALRHGPLTTASDKRVPSVFTVLESARQAMKADPPKPKPEQKPLEGCVSCKRDDGYFTAIDMHNHSKRSMCRVCGDYASGEGKMLPLGAIQYMHRTGKQLTWKIIEQAERTARAS